MPAAAGATHRSSRRSGRPHLAACPGPRVAAARAVGCVSGGKFTLAVGVLVLALVAIAATGWAGLARSDRQLDQLYADNLQALARAFELADVLHARRG